MWPSGGICKSGGNSGIFVWAAESSLEGLKPGTLPRGGIEVQVLDHGYNDQYEKQTGKKADWFTTHGDVFPVGTSTMTPFPPVSPDGHRSFPAKHLSKGVGEWNHYYIRCINGEVRLWVNGEEVSGGTGCEPRAGLFMPGIGRVRRWNSGNCGSGSCREGGSTEAVPEATDASELLEKSIGELPADSDQRKPASHSISRSRMTTSSTISPSSSINSPELPALSAVSGG